MWPSPSVLGQSTTMNIILEVSQYLIIEWYLKKPVLRRICDQGPGGVPPVQNEFYYLYYSGGFPGRQNFSFFQITVSLQSLPTMVDDARKKSVQISPFLQEATTIRVETGFNSRTCKAGRPASPPVSPTAATLPWLCFLIDASLSLYCGIILQPFVPVPRARTHKYKFYYWLNVVHF